MEQERKRIKLEHAEEKKRAMIKRMLNKNYDLQHMALRTLKSNVDDVRLKESRNSRALNEPKNEESERKVPHDIRLEILKKIEIENDVIRSERESVV